MFDNSDEFDFNPSQSSKLSSLFNNSTLSDDNNSSLTYTAPKQPKAKKETDSQEFNKSKIPSSVLVAKIISLWKLEDKEYKSLGKHCVALIGSTDLNLYEVIAYKEKHKVLLRQKVDNSWSFYNQRDNFSSFYDKENQNWLLKFENVADQNAFCKEIKICGASIICFEEPSAQKIEKNASVKPENVSSLNPEISQNYTVAPDKSHEDVHSDSSGSQKRANILTRMAKMGQQILPNQILKNTSTDLSDSEIDDRNDVQKSLPRKFKRTVHSEKPTVAPEEEKVLKLPQPRPQHGHLESQMVPSHSNISMQLPQSISTPIVYNQPIPYDNYNHYIIAQNTDLKMNLAHISTKLDTLLSGKDIHYNTSDNVLKSKIKVLELRSENLQAEMEMYKEQCYNLQIKCEKLKKINLDTSKTDENKTVIDSLNKEIDKLRLQIAAADEKIISYQDLEDKFKKCKTEIDVYKETIEIQHVKLKELQVFYEENKENQNLQIRIDDLNNTMSDLKQKLDESEKSFQKIELEKQRYFEGNNKNSEMFGDKIKEHMNIMYQSIISSFNKTETYLVSDINSKIVKNLKETTFRILEDFKQLYKTESATDLKE